jgi:hypothetical protein
LRYKSKGSCITAVSNKEHLSYVESKKLVNDLLSKEDCKSLKDRMDHLESNSFNIDILKNSYETSLKAIEEKKEKRIIDRKMKSIQKKAERFLLLNETDLFEFNTIYYRKDKKMVYNPVSKLVSSIKIPKQLDIETYMTLIQKIYGLIQSQTKDTKDRVITKLKKIRKDYCEYMKDSDLFINQLGSLLF